MENGKLTIGGATQSGNAVNTTGSKGKTGPKRSLLQQAIDRAPADEGGTSGGTEGRVGPSNDVKPGKHTESGVEGKPGGAAYREKAVESSEAGAKPTSFQEVPESTKSKDISPQRTPYGPNTSEKPDPAELDNKPRKQKTSAKERFKNFVKQRSKSLKSTKDDGGFAGAQPYDDPRSSKSSSRSPLGGAENHGGSASLMDIISLAKSKENLQSKPDEDKTKGNLAELLLHENTGDSETPSSYVPSSPSIEARKQHSDSPQGNDTIHDPKNSPKLTESSKLSRSGSLQDSASNRTTPEISPEGTDVPKEGSRSEGPDQIEVPEKKTESRWDQFWNQKSRTKSLDRYGSFEVIELEEPAKNPESQKNAIAAYLLRGLGAQMVPAYVGSKHPKQIQAEVHSAAKPENDEVLDDSGVNTLNDSNDPDSRNTRSQSADPDDRLLQKEHRKEGERASSEPPEYVKDFLRRKGPQSQRSLSTEDTSEGGGQVKHVPPEELKSKMADSQVTSDQNDQDVYVGQLREVFKSCCPDGEDKLNRSELQELCSKLELGESSDELVDKLMKNSSTGQVGFPEFKEQFVKILATSMTEDDDVMTHDDDITEMDSDTEYTYSDNTHGLENYPRLEKMSSEEEDLRGIWKQLGVGKSGYLSLDELRKVCVHIGMDDMDQEELQQLFDKLDVDTDGRVSFNEFSQGLFQHGSTPNATPRPSSTSRDHDKLRLSSLGGARGSGGGRQKAPSKNPTLLTQLNEDGTGYAKPEAVTELWNKNGVQHGAEILEFLQFDTRRDINLSDLSSALNNELKTTEEDNATYQAALASCQAEIKHLKSTADGAIAERDKLKADLNEANARNALLLREGEDSQSSLEKLREMDVKNLERKHQEQLKQLGMDKDREREAVEQQLSEDKQILEEELEDLKEEEMKLKEKLLRSQKEVKKLDEELEKMEDKCLVLEKAVLRQQRELDSAGDLRSRLEEMEASRDDVINEHKRFSLERIQHLEDENKDLRDKNDEVNMEIEDLKLQLVGSKKRKSRASDGLKSGGTSPKTLRKNPLCVGGIEGADAPAKTLPNSPLCVGGIEGADAPSRTLNKNPLCVGGIEGANAPVRKLPKNALCVGGIEGAEEDTKTYGGLEGVIQNSSQDGAVILTEYEIRKIEEEKEDKIRSLERAFSTERKDIEEMYKVQLAELEEQHDKEKKELIKFFHKEKEGLKSKLEKEFENRLAENERKLIKEFADEKQDLILKWETEKNHLNQRHLEEKFEIEDAVRTEMNEKMRKKVKEKQESFEKELDNSDSKRKEELDEEKRQKSKLEKELNKLREKFQEEKVDMVNEFSKEKSELSDKYEKKILDLESVLSKKGKEGLRGRLQADFYALLEKEKQEITIEQKGNTKAELEEEKLKLAKTFENEKNELEATFKKEKEKLEKKYQEIVGEIKMEKSDLSDKLNVEKAHLEKLCKQRNEDLAKEHENREKQLKNQKKDLLEKVDELEETISVLKRQQLKKEKVMALQEKQLSMDIQEKLEEEFVDQIKRLKDAFERERSQLEDNVKVLKEELNEVNRKKIPESKVKRLEDEIKMLKKDREKLENIKSGLQRNFENLQRANKDMEKKLEKKRETDILARELEKDLERQKGEKKDLERKLKRAKESESKVKELESQIEDVKFFAKLEAKKDVEKKFEEKEVLFKDRLHDLEEKANNADIKLRLAETAHQREKQELQDQINKTMVQKDQYDLIHERFLLAQKDVKDLENKVSGRERDASKMVEKTHAEYKNKLKELSKEKDEAERKLETARELLKEQTQKLLDQLERNNKTDVLIKDLYVENSKLMKTLYETERKAKETNAKLNQMDEKYRSLQNVVTKVSMAALA